MASAAITKLRKDFDAQEWKESRKGNPYLVFRGHIITVYKSKAGLGISLQRERVDAATKVNTVDAAKQTAFDLLAKELGVK